MTNPNDEFSKILSKMTSARGTFPAMGKLASSGQKFFPVGYRVPAITWGDAALIGSSLLSWIEPASGKGWISAASNSVKVLPGGLLLSAFIGSFTPKETSSYKRARTEFLKWAPLQVLMSQGFSAVSAAVELRNKILSGALYPYAEEFWGSAGRLMKAASAFGEVPSDFSIAAESVDEAIDELPDNVRKGLRAAADVAYGALPNFGLLAEIIKWSSIGGGLFMLYWYVLRPRLKK